MPMRLEAPSYFAMPFQAPKHGFVALQRQTRRIFCARLWRPALFDGYGVKTSWLTQVSRAMPALPEFALAHRPSQPMLAEALRHWGGGDDLWIFGYGSLIWRPDFDFSERRMGRVFGWHRALKMWSTINRGTPQTPGLVFGMLPGGSCQGMVFRIAREHGHGVLEKLWQREMVNAVYDPRWLQCRTEQGPVKALAFTLSRHSPNHTGELQPEEYRRIFREARGIYGSTRDYALSTFRELQRMGIHDRALQRLLHHAGAAEPQTGD